MNEKEQFDAYMQLAQFRSERRRVRRQLEWKISVSVWALLVASTYAITTRPPEWVLASVLGGVVVLHGLAWLSHMWSANRRDMEVAFYFMNLAADIVKKDRPKEARPAVRDWLSPVEWLFTIILAVMAFALVGKHYIRY